MEFFWLKNLLGVIYNKMERLKDSYEMGEFIELEESLFENVKQGDIILIDNGKCYVNRLEKGQLSIIYKYDGDPVIVEGLYLKTRDNYEGLWIHLFERYYKNHKDRGKINKLIEGKL